MSGPAARIVMAAALTLLGMQSIRLFTTGLVWVVGETSDRVVLLLMALAAFASSGLAWPLVRLLGWRRAFLLGAVGLGAARIADQAVASPVVDVWLGVAGTAFFGWVMATFLAVQGRTSGVGLAAGLALDVGVRAGLLTVDAPYTQHPAAAAVTLVLAVAAILLAWPQARAAGAPADGRRAWAAGGIPCGFALFMLANGNFGQVSAGANMAWGATVAWVTGGAVAGLGWAALPGRGRWRLVSAALAAVAVVAGLVVFRAAGQGWGAALVGAGLGCLIARMPAERGIVEQGRGGPGAGGAALGVAVGFVLLLIFVFTFYSFYSPEWVFYGLAAVAVACGVAGAIGRETGSPAGRWAAAAVLALAVAAAIPGAIRAATAAEALPVAAHGGRQVRVLSYNIRQGFGIANRWDLEGVAREIERHSPDIVALQEVGRGWVIAGMADQLLWLSRRLNMRLYFGSNIGDLWGNAVLTRLPTRSENHRFGIPSRVPRGVLEVNVLFGGGGLRVLVLHLDHQDDGAPTRLQQIDTVLNVWKGDPNTLIVGDFNATPESEEYAKLTGAGLRDLLKEAGKDVATSPADAPARRIDYAFGSADLRLLRAEAPASLASDHLPVLVEVALP